jgi:hypothetical protein
MLGHTRIDQFFLEDDFFEIVNCSTCYFAVDALLSFAIVLNCTISFDCIVYCRKHMTLDGLNRNMVDRMQTTRKIICHCRGGQS